MATTLAVTGLSAVMLGGASPAVASGETVSTLLPGHALRLRRQTGAVGSLDVRARVLRPRRVPETPRAGHRAMHRGGGARLALRPARPRGARPCHDPRLRVAIDGRPVLARRGRARAEQTLHRRLTLDPGAHTVTLRAAGCPWRVRDVTLGPPAVELGASVRVGALDNPPYVHTLTNDFDSLTPEDAMKMERLEPQRGSYRFGPADRLVGFAADHGLQVRGHTLIWGQQLPTWLTNVLLPYTRAELIHIMDAYITTVVSHFRGRVGEWDVVNEAIDAAGGYTPNLWERTIGPEYVALAFRFAHAADPDARLVDNEALTRPGVQADAVARMVSGLRAHGVPIDAVGVQNHTDILTYAREDRMESLLHELAATGAGVEITEMDVVDPLLGRLLGRGEGPWKAAADACAAVSACSRFTVWGVADPWSWRGELLHPLLFDDAYAPKPAYAAVRRALAMRP